MKTRQVNEMTNYIGAVYTKNNNELLWPIKSIVNCDENQIGNDYRVDVVYIENEIVMSWLIGLGTVCDEN